MKRDWQRYQLAEKVREKVSTGDVRHLMTDDGKKLRLVNGRAVSVRQHDQRALRAKRVRHSGFTRSRHRDLSNSEQIATPLCRCFDFRREARASCGPAQSFLSLPETSKPECAHQ